VLVTAQTREHPIELIELSCHDVQTCGQLLTLGFQSGLRARQFTGRQFFDGEAGRPTALPLNG
jgi:hypothetical protein